MTKEFSVPYGKGLKLPVFFKQRRAEVALSVLDCARILGLKATQSVYDWESGHSRIPLVHLGKLSELLNVPEETLFELWKEDEIFKFMTKLSKRILDESKTRPPAVKDSLKSGDV